MANYNAHPAFQKILDILEPPKEDAFTQLERMHRAALQANVALMKGYSLLLVALNTDGMNRQTLREIIGNALDQAAKEIDHKDATHQI